MALARPACAVHVTPGCLCALGGLERYGPPLHVRLGALLGEYVGELFYILIKGDGIGAVGEKLKKDITALFTAGKNAMSWIGDGFKRYFDGISKVNFFGLEVPDPRKLINFELFGKAFFSRDPINETKEQKAERLKREKESEGAGEPGNVIQVSHPHTGKGFGIKGLVDYKGRPAVFSKSAASAFGKMMIDSKGVVKGSDIASSQRSKEYNASLPGASPTSHHLYGNAIDIHGDSNDWIRKHGAKYGWKPNDYKGTHGGHFEFKGLEGGGSIGPKRNIGALEMQTDYEDDYIIMIQPVIIEKVVPVESNTVSFPSPTSVNSNILETFTHRQHVDTVP